MAANSTLNADAAVELLLGNRLLVSLLVVAVSLVLYQLLGRKKESFPGPRSPSLFFGNSKEIADNEPMTKQLEWAVKYGPYVRYHTVLSAKRLLVTDLDALKHILSTNSSNWEKPMKETKFLKTLLGNGLVTSDTVSHAHQRKILNPIFHYNNLKALMPTFVESAYELRTKWIKLFESEPDVKTRIIDVQYENTLVALDVIGRAGFGYDFQAVQKGADGDVIYEAFNTILGPSNIGVFYNIPGYSLLPTEYNRKFKSSVEQLHKSVLAIVEEKKRRLATEGHPKKPSLIDMMMKASEEPGADVFSSKELADQILTFLAAGNETSASTMTWTLMFLAQNQRVQDKLRAEVREYIKEGADMEEPVDGWNNVDRLVYLNNVVRESLRLRSPAPSVIRANIKDDVLGGQHIPAGTRVIISPGVIHRLPSVWGEDALVYRPERWENSEPTSAYAYMPFVMGPRNCIGNRFALLEVKVVITVLVRCFKFETIDDSYVMPKHAITMRPEPNLKLKVTRILD